MGLDALVDKADEILRHCPLAERGEARLLEPIRKLLEVLQAVELARLRSAPVQAKIVAIGFVEVCSPLRYL